MLWSARAHHCVHSTSCLCTLSCSQCIHALIHPYISLFLIFHGAALVGRGPTSAAHALAVRARVHWRMASNSQYALPPQSSPQESARDKSQLCSKQSSNGPSPENFVTIGGYFDYLWLFVTIGGFIPFQVCHFKIITTRCYSYCRLGKSDVSISSPAMTSPWKR